MFVINKKEIYIIVIVIIKWNFEIEFLFVVLNLLIKLIFMSYERDIDFVIDLIILLVVLDFLLENILCGKVFMIFIYDWY